MHPQVGGPIQLVLAHHDLSWMMDVAGELAQHSQIKVIGFAQTGELAVERASSMAADGLLIVHPLVDMDGMEAARRLAEESPGSKTFMVAQSPSAQLVMKARAAGVAEVFSMDGLVPREVAEKIVAQVENFRRELDDAASRHGVAERGSGPLGIKVKEQVVARPITQSIILTHSPKGGVGKSTIAVNLAAAIKQSPIYSGMRVALLDFDIDFGNLATLCGLPKHLVWSRNIALWEQVAEDLSPQAIDELMIPMTCGVMVCPAPLIPSAAEGVTMEVADKILRILRKHYGVIVIDGGPKVNAVVDAAMHHATHILMVATPEGQAAENLSRIVQFLSPDPNYPEKPDMGHLLRKTYLVVNRVQKRRGDLSPAEVAQIVGRPVIAELPEDEAVGSALHSLREMQAVEVYPDSAFAVAVKNLANDLTGAYPQGIPKGKAKKGMFRKLMGRGG